MIQKPQNCKEVFLKEQHEGYIGEFIRRKHKSKIPDGEPHI